MTYRSSSTQRLRCVAALSCVALFGCQLSPGDLPERDEELLAEALTAAVSFEDGTVIDGPLPASTRNDIGITPLEDVVIVSPGAPTRIMALIVDNPDEGSDPVASTLIQFANSRSYVDVEATTRRALDASTRDPSVTEPSEPSATEVVIENGYTVDANVCATLCDKIYATTVTEASVLESGAIGARSTREIAVDCRDAGSRDNCGASTDDEVSATLVDGEGSTRLPSGGGGGSAGVGGDGEGGSAGDPAGTAGTAGGLGTAGGGNGGAGGSASQPGGAVGTYLWVANTAQGTVSKIDTMSMVEVGRYMTSPAGDGLPSRISVSESGRAAVANRASAVGRPSGDAGVTVYLPNEVDCQDLNGNGTIDTSTGRSDVKPWGEDECIAWHAPSPWISQRVVAWARSQGGGEELLWTAGVAAQGECTDASCQFEVQRLDGATGTARDTINVSGLSGTDMLTAAAHAYGPQIGDYGPHAGATDAAGNLWLVNANTTDLVYVDGNTLQWRSWPIPSDDGYAITIDSGGYPIVCGGRFIFRFDPSSERWNQSDGVPVDLGFNGCATDGAGTLWVGGGADDGLGGLHAFDASTLQHMQSEPVGSVKGVSVDANGFVWGVDAASEFSGAGIGSEAYRLDPVSGDVTIFGGLDEAYSFGDMTGIGLLTAGFTPLQPGGQ